VVERQGRVDMRVIMAGVAILEANGNQRFPMCLTSLPCQQANERLRFIKAKGSECRCGAGMPLGWSVYTSWAQCRWSAAADNGVKAGVVRPTRRF
jgi:hypothetical protein